MAYLLARYENFTKYNDRQCGGWAYSITKLLVRWSICKSCRSRVDGSLLKRAPYCGVMLCAHMSSKMISLEPPSPPRIPLSSRYGRCGKSAHELHASRSVRCSSSAKDAAAWITCVLLGILLSYIISVSYTHSCISTGPRSQLRTELGLPEWIPRLIIHPQPDLLLLLCRHMLDPNLLRMTLHELSNKPRVPELTRNTQVFAATHQCIGFTALRSGRYAFWGEILLFAAGY